MTVKEFQEQIKAGIPDVLPAPKPYDPTINHAPKRKEILTEEERVLAIRNALRYFPAKHHEVLAREFAEELHKYGRIYMYRFRPDYEMYARPIEEYPHKSRQAAAIMVMIPVGHWYKSFLLRLRKAEGETLKTSVSRPLPMGKTVFSIAILLILIFSKYIYMASLNSYYTFYLIHKFGVSVQASQLYLFVFLIATAIGTLLGGPIGDRVGRKYVIWASILGAAPFTLIMPHVENLYLTTVLSFCVGLTLSSAFPAILVYAQELLPYKLGLISGLFFGFAFGVAGIASAVLGNMADRYGIEAVYNVCGYMPLIGLVTWFLPDLKKKR